VRRHLKHIDHPIIGDVRYGKGEHNRLFRRRFGLERMALHAASLQLSHPLDKTPLLLTAPLPADLANVRAALCQEPRDAGVPEPPFFPPETA
jgi:tRNA pseudouridine65 synthase